MGAFSSVGSFFSNMIFRPRYNGVWWNPISLKDYWNNDKVMDHFLCIPELNAVLNMSARAFSSGMLKVVNDKMEEQINNPISKVLQNPNWFQGQREFLRQTKLYHDIYGNEYVYLFFPVGFKPDTSLKAIYTLPPNLVKAELKDRQPFFLFRPDTPPNITYYIKDEEDNSNYPITEECIVHLNDNKVNISKIKDSSILKGESKIKSLTAPLSNIRMAYESRGVILKYRGALGILSNAATDVSGSIPVGPEDRDKLQREYAQTYGGLEGQHQLIITNANLKYQQMGVNPDKLGLYQECEEDFISILDAYNVPPELFARKTSTYENKNAAEKGFYQNNIIPTANEWVGALNNAIFYDSPYKIIADFSHLPIFQEDLKIKSEAMNSMVNVLSKLLQDKQITIEEYRSELGKIGLGSGKPIPVEVGDNSEVETRKAQANLRGSVGGVQGIITVQQSMAAGTTTRESAIAILIYVYGFTEEQANEIVGLPKELVEQPVQEEEETIN